MDEYIQNMIDKAKKAQKELESYSQEQIDELVKRIAKVVFDNAELCAKMAVEESGMGNVEHKIIKKKAKARILWFSMKGKKTMGIIARNELTGITEIAKPVGVVAAVQPCTNPIVTPMANAMAAIKCRNTIIISPHPRTANCTKVFVEMVKESWKDLNPPENILQTIENPTIERTKNLMSSVDVVVATGGPDMVKSAYSSGKPSYGVGPGNVQCIIDSDIDYGSAVEKIILGRTFDNGIICSGEQSVIMPAEKKGYIISLFKKNKTFLVAPEDIPRFKEIIFPNGKIAKHLVGKDVQTIAAACGISVPKDTVLIAVDCDGEPKDSVLRREKMFPVISFFSYEEFGDAIATAQHNLSLEGMGHSVCIHSNNKTNIEKVGLTINVCRVVVNQPCATTNGGSFTNGLAPTCTLGCGSWGNNSISENFTYKHLLNITRIAYELTNVQIPTDEQLWG